MRKSCSGNGFDEYLPWEYERELIRRVQRGDSRAEEILVGGYRKLISAVAKKLATKRRLQYGIWNDMAVEGEVAVVRAARRFDLSRGNKFFPYCKKFVEFSLWTVSFDGFSAAGLPTVKFRRAALVRAALETLGRCAEVDDLSELSGLDVDEVRELLPAALAPHVGGMEWLGTNDDHNGDDDPPSLEEAAVQSLTEFERDCADAVYAKVWTVAAAARRHGVCAEDVYDGARRAAEKLRAMVFGPQQFELEFDNEA